jgi:hypothetical protein
LSEDCARPDGEDLASHCEFNLALGPVKKFRAQFGFQVPDLLTQWRLAQMQSFGSPTKVQCVGHGKKISEVPEFHKRDPHRRSRANISQKSGLGTKNVFYGIQRLL